MNDNDYAFRGYGVKGYRCFSDESACAGPFGKVHIITGRNNSGKSALADVAVRFLQRVRGGSWSGKEQILTNSDIPLKWYGRQRGESTLSLCFSRESILKSRMASRIQTQESKENLHTVLESSAVTRGSNGSCWFDFELEPSLISPTEINGLKLKAPRFVEIGIAEDALTNLNNELSGTSFASSSKSLILETTLQEIIRQVIPWDEMPARVIKVDALREATSDVQSKREQRVDGGAGLINKLLDLSNPLPVAQYEAGKKWGQFVAFVRDILDDSQAEVRIDANASMITVKTDGTDYLSLSDLGTGVEQLVILAAVVSCNSNSLIVIEEPEVHLHPTLQAKIVKNLLDDQNRNRFIITTHSPTIINSEGVSITWVEKEGGVSRAREVCDTVRAREVLDDIGARPSDLLQSNYIVWVEGPSDRVYVNYWLSSVAPELREGVHYSVMLYGGRLLNALDAGPDEPPEELIALFKINPHFCVIMDSDRKNEGASISATKRRIEKECEKSDCMSWVTDGKTIENYVPADVLRVAFREVYGDRQYDGKFDDRYVGPLDHEFPGVKTKPDKIRIARAVVRRRYELGQDLREKADELARRIRQVNGVLGAGGWGSYLLRETNIREPDSNDV